MSQLLVPKKSSNAVLEAISRSSTDGGWQEAAGLAAEILQEGNWIESHPSAADWLADAAGRTAYSVNTFRRQVRVVEYLNERIGDVERQRLQQRDLPFSSLEILVRLADIDPHKASELLPTVLDGSVGVAKIREIYHAAQTGEKGATRGPKVFSARARQFVTWSLECIHFHSELFMGGLPERVSVQFRNKLRGFPYASPDLVAITPDFADAFEMKLFGTDDAKHVLLRTLEQVSLMSSFFRQTWLIYPLQTPPIETHQQFVQDLSAHLIALKLDSVGVAQIPSERSQNIDDGVPVTWRNPIPQRSPPRAEILTRFLRAPS